MAAHKNLVSVSLLREEAEIFKSVQNLNR